MIGWSTRREAPPSSLSLSVCYLHQKICHIRDREAALSRYGITAVKLQTKNTHSETWTEMNCEFY